MASAFAVLPARSYKSQPRFYAPVSRNRRFQFAPRNHAALARNGSAFRDLAARASRVGRRIVRMAATTENRVTLVQRGLSEWWSEETEHAFQRIERWAAFARGYNRLRSRRWSKERRTSVARSPSWHASIRKPSVDETTSSRLYSAERSRPRSKSRPEDTRINCCGTFSYQSNCQLDSNCLETYRYDHSIYFKTIGDIRSDRRHAGDHDEDATSISSEELVEWDAVSHLTDLPADASTTGETRDDCPDVPKVPVTVVEPKTNQVMRNAWPIVDLARLDLNPTDVSRVPHPVRKCHGENDKQLENNNADSPRVETADSRTRKEDRESGSKAQERIRRSRSFRKSRRSSRNVRGPSIVGENSVVWPGILLNYANVADRPPRDQ